MITAAPFNQSLWDFAKLQTIPDGKGNLVYIPKETDPISTVIKVPTTGAKTSDRGGFPTMESLKQTPGQYLDPIQGVQELANVAKVQQEQASGGEGPGIALAAGLMLGSTLLVVGLFKGFTGLFK